MKTILTGVLLAAFAVAANAGDPMKSKSFKDLDANGDGKLSPAEVASMTSLKTDFRGADSNSDGFLSEAEYQTWTTGHKPADKPTGG
jgi:hypothetical protein